MEEAWSSMRFVRENKRKRRLPAGKTSGLKKEIAQKTFGEPQGESHW